MKSFIHIIFGIAIIASVADVLAPEPWGKAVIGPLNPAVRAHHHPLLLDDRPAARSLLVFPFL
jgi:hypothetical protein